MNKFYTLDDGTSIPVMCDAKDNYAVVRFKNRKQMETFDGYVQSYPCVSLDHAVHKRSLLVKEGKDFMNLHQLTAERSKEKTRYVGFMCGSCERP